MVRGLYRASERISFVFGTCCHQWMGPEIITHVDILLNKEGKEMLHLNRSLRLNSTTASNSIGIHNA
jgi:hypothetical protein